MQDLYEKDDQEKAISDYDGIVPIVHHHHHPPTKQDPT